VGDKMNKALLVIDVQNAITNQNNPAIERTLSYINQVIATFPKEEVYYIRHIEDGTEFDESNTDSYLSSKLLIVNDQIFKKHFNSAFLQTELDDVLKQKNITDIYIVGFQTEFCVDATIKTGHFLGYHVHVYKQGHDTFDREISAEKLKEHYNHQFQNYADMIE